MKYIVGKEEILELEKFVSFSETLKHNDVAHRLGFKIIVSAGFIYYDDCIADEPKFYCTGSSSSLNIGSRGNIDTILFLRDMTQY